MSGKQIDTTESNPVFDDIANNNLTEKSISDFITRRRILATGRLPSYDISGPIKTINSNDFGTVFTLREYKKLIFKTIQYVNFEVGRLIRFYAMEDSMPVMWVHRFDEVPKYHVDTTKFKTNVSIEQILNDKSKKDFKQKKILLDFGQLPCLAASGKINNIVKSDYGTIFCLEKNGYVFKSIEDVSYDEGEFVKFSVIGENKQDVWAFNFPVPECNIL